MHAEAGWQEAWANTFKDIDRAALRCYDKD